MLLSHPTCVVDASYQKYSFCSSFYNNVYFSVHYLVLCVFDYVSIKIMVITAALA